MSIWNNIFGAKPVSADFYSFIGSGTPERPEAFFDFSNQNIDELKAFYTCGILRTVVQRNAQAMANGRWWILDGTDMTASDMSSRYASIELILNQPNPYQQWAEFIIQCEIYRQIFGEVYIYASVPEGFSNDRSERLWALAPSEVNRCPDGTVAINVDGSSITVSADRLCNIKDAGSFCKPNLGQQIIGIENHKSRVHSAIHAVKNIIQAEESIYSINHDRGALGILTTEDKDAAGRVAITPAEKQSLLDQIRETYGIGRHKSKIMVSNSALKWQQMSMSVKDLMLIEGMDKNMETICNVFDYPRELLVSDSKYSNKATAKGYYEDSVIPFSQIYASKLKSFLGLQPTDYFVVDFSQVPAMKEAEDQKAKVYYQKATAVQKLYIDGVLSREEARLEMGYEAEIEGKTMFNDKSNDNGGTDSGANKSA